MLSAPSENVNVESDTVDTSSTHNGMHVAYADRFNVVADIESSVYEETTIDSPRATVWDPQVSKACVTY